jgi:hypothetical protein
MRRIPPAVIEDPFGTARQEDAVPPRFVQRSRPPGRRRRRLVVFRAAAGPLVAVVLLAVLVNAALKPKARGAFGPFAGYLWTGTVSSVQASWRVPRVLPGSSPGGAATWIGAQRNDGPGPFIQIGTNENRDTVALETSNDYDAFWSDPKVHFAPQSLGPVNPGDYVSASMVLGGGEWHLELIDHTLSRTYVYSTADEASAHFGIAEWLEEDPTSSDTNKVIPYPRLSTVRFQQLAVNGAPPLTADLYSQWLSLPGMNLAPSIVSADQFAVAPAGAGDVPPAGSPQPSGAAGGS